MTRSGRLGGVVIEFFGMPGVGKTTLARGIAADLSQHGHNATFLAMDAPVDLNRYIKLARQVGDIGRYVAARPQEIFRAVRVLRYFPQPNALTYTKVMRYWLLTCAIIDRSRSGADIVLCDQGLYQGLYSLALLTSTPDREVFSTALHLLPRPDLAILVTADRETVRARLSGRRYNHRWIDKLLLNDRRRLEESEEIVQAIAAALRATDCSLIVYASTASVAADTQELAAAVRSHLEATVGTGGAPAWGNGSRLV